MRPAPKLLAGRSVAVVGLGKSGVAAARLCLERGAVVAALDEAPRARLSEAARGLADAGATLYASDEGGQLAAEPLMAAETIVVSPGLPPREVLARAERAGIEVVAEVELASRLISAPIVLIGGTNGKSTVTGLLEEIYQQAGMRAFVGGNYGTPVCEAVDRELDVAVVELSSFQAERLPSLHARVHALLNITEDHLDRYDDFQAYADAKGNPFGNMDEGDVAVLPAGDALCEAQAKRGRARRVTFDASGIAGGGPEAAEFYSDGEAIVARQGDARHALGAFKLRGKHNVANAAAAVAVANAMGAPSDAIDRALASFSGLAHRHALVATIAGVRFYDDSKATNVGAAVAALSGLEESRAVLIAGGRDKHGSYAPLVAALRERGRALVVIGEAAERLARAAAGALPIERAASLQEAVRSAFALAQPGDAVLLSPACSSYDMFPSFAVRGDAFAAAVRALECGDDV